MRSRSPKTAAIYREWNPIRNRFLAKFDWRCAICDLRNPELVHVHEITSGPARMRAFVERAAWLPACNPCNGDKLTDRALWPLAKQLAVKLELDPEWFDLDKINELIAIKGTPNPPRVVTGDDVLAEYRKLLISRRPQRWAA